MPITISLRLLPSEAANQLVLKQYIAAAAAVKETEVSGFTILKHSIDARGKQPRINLSLKAFIREPFQPRSLSPFAFKDVKNASHRVIIIGGGPAGLFAALQLIEKGIKPVILERGKDVRARRRDLAILNRKGELNPESNYCFGEGGAGTYSDGKLYTRSTKRGDISRILHLFVHFGAEEKILYESHPHIGTNKLPSIITSMRETIIGCGGEIFFEKKLTDFVINDQEIEGVRTADGDLFRGSAYILATGHSARDIYELLYSKKIQIVQKPFALGVRVEHPQEIIDSIQYHCVTKDPILPPASYQWVIQAAGKGVFSFCMCPGGIIAPAATSPGELVVNGWSPSKRNNPFANSGIVVSVETKDFAYLRNKGPLAGMYFQMEAEQKAFLAGGGKFVAPAQRLIDFIDNKTSPNLPSCSYQPGIVSAPLINVLPGFIHHSLLVAFKEIGKKMSKGPGGKAYLTNESVVVALESRTSSPVRVPRNPESLHHPGVKNFYPCGEGAGYAGGIVSAAMDGERVALQVAIICKQD